MSFNVDPPDGEGPPTVKPGPYAGINLQPSVGARWGRETPGPRDAGAV